MEYNETLIKARKIAIDLLNVHKTVRAVQRATGVNAYTIKNLADGSACCVTDAALKRLGLDVTTKIDRMMGKELHDALVRKFGDRAKACRGCSISHSQLSAIKKGRPPMLVVRKRIENVIFEPHIDARPIALGAWV